jgi:hypothetical protein
VNPDNAIDMVDILQNIFAVTGVDVPHLSAEAMYDYLPTNSLESEVVEMMKMQYITPIILARQKIVKLYADRNKSPRKPRKSMLVDESVEVVTMENNEIWMAPSLPLNDLIKNFLHLSPKKT